MVIGGLLLVACVDYGVSGAVEVADPVPHLALDPPELLLGPLPVGERVSSEVTLTSTGDAPLELLGAAIEGSTAFSLERELSPGHLDVGGSQRLVVVFEPTGEEHSGTLVVTSDDHVLPEQRVSLAGWGSLPVLEIDPDPFDMGMVELGCPRTLDVTLRNVGLADLEIAAATATGPGFGAEPEGLPWLLAPGEEHPLSIWFDPPDDEAFDGTDWVTSDELLGQRTSLVTATGLVQKWLSEEFRQGDGPWEKVDLLLAVDRSCSMSDDAASLANNFMSFADVLDEADVDWQVGVATQDSGCINSSLVTPETPDPGSAIGTRALGPGGAYTEALLTVSRNALEAASGCNLGLLREDSKTLVLLVSDEPEQSRETWSDLVVDILAAAPSATVNAVAGPVPGGCRGAAPGTGYQEAVAWTGGYFLSICESDWASHLEIVAGVALDPRTDTFVLQHVPDVDTLEVWVSGMEWTNGWYFDQGVNAVVFEEGWWPETGKRIEVRYLLPSDCD